MIQQVARLGPTDILRQKILASNKSSAPPKADDAAPAAPSQSAPPVSSAINGVLARHKASIDSIQPPPKLDLPPPPRVQATDPASQWGSIAMIAATLGSLLTRRPLTTALNAAADVMKAYHQGDQDAANAAFQTWKVANDNALKMADYEQKTYRTIMESANKESDLEMKGAIAQGAAVARANHDQVMEMHFQNQDATAVKNELDRRDAMYQKLSDAGAAGVKKQLETQAVHEYLNSDEGKKATKAEQLTAVSKLVDANSPAGQKLQAAKEQKQQESEIRLGALQNQITHAIGLLDAGGTAGMSGMVNRAKEVVGPWVGADVGASPAHQFDNLVSLIRTGASQEMSSPGMRSNAQFREALANLAQYIRPGQTQATQANALKLLKNYIDELHGKPDTYKDVTFLPGLPDRIPPSEDVPKVQKASFTAPTPKPVSKPGTSINAPMKYRTKSEYQSFPSGTWLEDANGNIGQKP